MSKEIENEPAYHIYFIALVGWILIIWFLSLLYRTWDFPSSKPQIQQESIQKPKPIPRFNYNYNEEYNENVSIIKNENKNENKDENEKNKTIETETTEPNKIKPSEAVSAKPNATEPVKNESIKPNETEPVKKLNEKMIRVPLFDGQVMEAYYIGLSPNYQENGEKAKKTPIYASDGLLVKIKLYDSRNNLIKETLYEHETSFNVMNSKRTPKTEIFYDPNTQKEISTTHFDENGKIFNNKSLNPNTNKTKQPNNLNVS